jgi:site-specific recombinase XerD
MDYLDLCGKRQRVSLVHRDIRKAQKQIALLEKELKMGFIRPESMSLKQLYLDHKEKTRGHIRQSTLSLNLAALEEFIVKIGNIDICNISFEHGERFLQCCLDKGNAPATAGRKIRHLKRVFQLAVDRGQLDSNPFRRLKLPRCPEKEIRVLDDTECQQLRKAATDHFQDYGFNWPVIIDLALFTGMRRGEILNLTWKDIDW